jgi:hypothetical protein
LCSYLHGATYIAGSNLQLLFFTLLLLLLQSNLRVHIDSLSIESPVSLYKRTSSD